MLRTNTCGELDKKDINNKIELAGWMHSRRDHGGLIFIDLRDRYGLTQIVFDPKHNKKVHSVAEHLRREDIVHINGKVRARGKGLENPKLKTGKIEVLVDSVEVIAKAATPPIEVDDRIEAGEEIRLKYRYLDLRRPIMQNRLLTRHKIAQSTREYFDKHNFLEIETPLLVKSTPEGARDYIVPSRVNLGKFYALPQSPQLYKQLLMISGCDRYYQIARCLRDEDLRIDRQPEHTQIDFEMSFVDSNDIREFIENLYKHLFKEVLNIKLDKFPILSYKESMDRFGTDKPDLRFGLELIDVTDIVKKSDFEVFQKVEQVKCINPKKDFTRKELDEYIGFCQKNEAKGMAWMRVTDEGLESNIVKFFNPSLQKKLLEKTKAKKGSVLMFIADKQKNVADVLSRLRLKLRDDLKLVKEKDFKFCWVVDFPLFAYNEDEDRWEPEHHMFSMPKPEFVKDFEKKPKEVIGDLWDIVLNGTELGSGSIRVTNPNVQERIMKLIGLNKQEAEKKFGFLLHAYTYGAPPHGGMGLGFDRLVALMCGLQDIREIIAFPKNKAAQCPMDGSPSDVPEDHLKELHIKSEDIKGK
ncbi:aspartate--tRNA ligase [Candidatus Woesearchaeota archaeon B3_Woes]|nr:MAG: aspartate--tRNA ligase [Candidatus Woesearchaeota archaeon B3_Woes]